MTSAERIEPERPWAEGAFLAMVDKHLTEDGEPMTMEVAEVAVVTLGLDTRAGRTRKEPDRYGEVRLRMKGEKRLHVFHDPKSPRFGEGIKKTAGVVAALAREGLLEIVGDRLHLTPLGRAEASIVLEHHRADGPA